MTKELEEALRNIKIRCHLKSMKYDPIDFDLETVEEALQRLDKYEQILGSGRLTDRNYKNTTLDLDSCKPYLKLGQLEDIYEEGK